MRHPCACGNSNVKLSAVVAKAWTSVLTLKIAPTAQGYLLQWLRVERDLSFCQLERRSKGHAFVTSHINAEITQEDSSFGRESMTSAMTLSERHMRSRALHAPIHMVKADVRSLVRTALEVPFRWHSKEGNSMDFFVNAPAEQQGPLCVQK